MTALDPNPMRVRNIFICSGVVFCASSRMMKLLFRVRPRMNASGATSMAPRSSSRCGAFGLDHVVEGVVERAQVRVDLGHEVAGQEAEPLAGLDRRSGQDDAVDLLASAAPARPMATASQLLPVPAGPTPKVTMLSRMAST